MNWLAGVNSQGFELATTVESFYQFLQLASVAIASLVIGGLLLFAFNFRKRQQMNHAGSEDKKSADFLVESAWSFVPIVIFVAIFAWGWS